MQKTNFRAFKHVLKRLKMKVFRPAAGGNFLKIGFSRDSPPPLVFGSKITRGGESLTYPLILYFQIFTGIDFDIAKQYILESSE